MLNIKVWDIVFGVFFNTIIEDDKEKIVSSIRRVKISKIIQEIKTESEIETIYGFIDKDWRVVQIREIFLDKDLAKEYIINTLEKNKEEIEFEDIIKIEEDRKATLNESLKDKTIKDIKIIWEYVKIEYF